MTNSLFDSVKDWFNLPQEIELRIKEVEKGLTDSERKLLRYLQPHSRVLDIGCAVGRTAIALAQEGHTITGVDVAEQLIEKARRTAKERKLDITFQICDPLNLSFSANSFDAVLLLKTYCYIPKRENRINWLHEIARMLKPEGWLFLSQYIIDDVLGSYVPIHEENQKRFPLLFDALEEGDGFSLPSEGSNMVSFIHYFVEADLVNELSSSPFQIVDSFREGTIYYGALQKPH